MRVHTDKERVQPGSSEHSGVWYLAQRHLGRGPGTSPATKPPSNCCPPPFSSQSPACRAVILCTCRLCISSRFHAAASYFRISNRRVCHHCEPNTSEESVVSAPLRGRSFLFSGGRVATFLISNRCRKADVWEPSVLLEGIYPHRQRKTQTQACSVIDTSR